METKESFVHPRRKIHLGISTCPNDTFAFAGILTGAITSDAIDFDVELLDIQQLNDRLQNGDFDVAKTSFAAATAMDDRVVLPVGSAIGYGVGPLLLAAKPNRLPGRGSRHLCPGKGTTAAMLFDLFYPDCGPVDHVVFSDIMPMLIAGEADFGVCIHEGRFTWQDQGLHLVEDLGSRWEREFKCPLPLGGLIARDDLDACDSGGDDAGGDDAGGDLMRVVIQTIGRSLDWARTDPSRAIATMRHYAQSMDDDVLMNHVDLYVNDWTVDLGGTGRAALSHFYALAGKTPRFAD